jgi:hypothetical protein
MKKKVLSAILTFSMMIGVFGCGAGSDTAINSTTLPQGAYDNEIITTTPVAQDKTMITVRVEFGSGQDVIFENLFARCS